VDETTKKAFSERAARTFSANLKRLRKEKGLTQEDLGSRSGLHRTHIGYLENGARLPWLPTIYLIANALGVDAGLLLAGFSDPRSDQDSK
jgi:transcriptional regulator with XRE-family HTH domain